MTDEFARRGTIVWAVICTLTLLSTWLGGHTSAAGLLDSRNVALAVLAIAVIKARLIIMHFMEIAQAPLPLRLIFELWIAFVFGLLLVLYSTGSAAA